MSTPELSALTKEGEQVLRAIDLAIHPCRAVAESSISATHNKEVVVLSEIGHSAADSVQYSLMPPLPPRKSTAGL